DFHVTGVQTCALPISRGKTTVATLIYQILKQAGKSVHLAGNIRGVATLGLLNKAKLGDIVVLELSSWQLQGFGERRISPSIAVRSEERRVGKEWRCRV